MEKQHFEVAPGITCFQEPFGVRLLSFFALDNGDTITLFDGGNPNSVTHWIEAGQLSKPIDRLIVSHSDADHFGDGANLKQRFPDMQILCHAADKHFIENHAAIVKERYGFSHALYGIGYPPETLDALRGICGDDLQVDATLEDGDQLEIGNRTWEVLHVAGHSPGHISLWSAADGILWFADAVLGFGPPEAATWEPSMPSTHEDIEPYLKTIERFEGLPVKLALPAHWQPMDGSQFADFLTKTRQNIERDLNFVRQACQEKPQTFSSLLDGINEAFRVWEPADDMNYIFALHAALQYLIAQGEITDKDGLFHAGG